MARDSDWIADLQRYGGPRAFLREQSVWAVWIYRLGCRIDRRPEGIFKRFLNAWYWVAFRAVETIVGVSLPKGARIGAGLRIWHFGGIFIHPNCVIGSNCTLRQGVTIGNRMEGGPVPVLGDDVDIGAHAQLLGGIHVGNGCKIGAMAVVVSDIPDGATAVGGVARIIPAKKQESETEL